MNVLIVDDQKEIIKGMINGITWNTHGIEKVFSASSVSQAKKILLEESVQIIFSDIEMPGEDGIALAEWLNTAFPEIVNIFLTSHADFSYARQAVTLGAFEYILQPARYEDIEKALDRAIEKWNLENQKKQMYVYGKYLENKKNLMVENLIYNLLNNSTNNLREMTEELRLLQYQCNMETRIIPFLLHLLDKEKDFKNWDPALQQFLMYNILTEIIASNNIESLVYSAWNDSILIILVEDDRNQGIEVIRQIQQKMQECLKGKVAFYVGNMVKLCDIKQEYDLLEDGRRNNVALHHGIFYSERAPKGENTKIELTKAVLERWDQALRKGMTGIVRSEIMTYLKQMDEGNKATLGTMIEFHQKFIQTFLNIMAEKGMNPNEVFSDEFSYPDFLSSYHNIDEIKRCVDFALQVISKEHMVQVGYGTYVDFAKEYIIDHMEEFVKVQDIAAHLGLNAEYLSRCFKKEQGTSMKDFILRAKMETAKDLLRATTLSVSEISGKVGYDNFSNFIQVFKKHESVTPMEYRRTNKSKN